VKFLHFSEGLIEFYPRSGFTGIVEIYRVCGTEGDVVVENIHIYICLSQVNLASMNVEKGGVNYTQGGQ
jgi:hypothetical protein